MVRQNAAGEKHTALWTSLVTLAFVACAVSLPPPLHVSADTVCPPPADLPSAPWTAALLFAGVAGAAVVLVKRGGGGPTSGTPARRRWLRRGGGGFAALIAMSLLSNAPIPRSAPVTSTFATASAATCPPAPSPSASPPGSSPPPVQSSPAAGSGGRSGVSGATTVPVPATGARSAIRDGVGR
ncbi:MAG: hypothetical protein JOZ75_14300 [Candidatus Dormibacteraeota bacterium]|nr:hypothetical protein [Candidatus Dormibacteraeota bacterium]